MRRSMLKIGWPVHSVHWYTWHDKQNNRYDRRFGWLAETHYIYLENCERHMKQSSQKLYICQITLPFAIYFLYLAQGLTYLVHIPLRTKHRNTECYVSRIMLCISLSNSSAAVVSVLNISDGIPSHPYMYLACSSDQFTHDLQPSCYIL